MFGGAPKNNFSFLLLKFFQTMAEKKLSNRTFSMYFDQNSIPGAKNSPECENFGKFHFFIQIKFKTIFAQNKSNSKILREFFPAIF